MSTDSRRALPLGTSRSRLLVALVFVLAAPQLAGGQTGSIIGVVKDSGGTGVAGVEITVAGSAFHALTDENGAFRLAQVPVGEAQMRARRLGFQPVSQAVRVEAGQESRAEIRLTSLAVRLPPVEVRRRADISDVRLSGFNARRTRQVGHFVTRERLDRMSSFRFVDALREVPGVQMRTMRGGGSTVILRGANCPPIVFIDGFPAAAGTFDLEMMDLASVEGIEIYHGITTVPPEFQTVRGLERCGVIAIWSRPARPRQNVRSPSATVDLQRLLAERRVYTADQVTEQAVPKGGQISPVYPESLWKARVPGRVVVEFIVGTQGRIEPGTLGVVSSTHAEFTSAVRIALDGVNFRAGQLDGRPIRQIVQLPFAFDPVEVPSPQPPRPSQ